VAVEMAREPDVIDRRQAGLRVQSG
jgi:hypothetical protein